MFSSGDVSYWQTMAEKMVTGQSNGSCSWFFMGNWDGTETIGRKPLDGIVDDERWKIQIYFEMYS